MRGRLERIVSRAEGMVRREGLEPSWLLLEEPHSIYLMFLNSGWSVSHLAPQKQNSAPNRQLNATAQSNSRDQGSQFSDSADNGLAKRVENAVEVSVQINHSVLQCVKDKCLASGGKLQPERELSM